MRHKSGLASARKVKQNFALLARIPSSVPDRNPSISREDRDTCSVTFCLLLKYKKRNNYTIVTVQCTVYSVHYSTVSVSIRIVGLSILYDPTKIRVLNCYAILQMLNIQHCADILNSRDCEAVRLLVRQFSCL